MGLGETMYGAGNGATHVIFLTVGTAGARFAIGY